MTRLLGSIRDPIRLIRHGSSRQAVKFTAVYYSNFGRITGLFNVSNRCFLESLTGILKNFEMMFNPKTCFINCRHLHLLPFKERH